MQNNHIVVIDSLYLSLKAPSKVAFLYLLCRIGQIVQFCCFFWTNCPHLCHKKALPLQLGTAGYKATKRKIGNTQTRGWIVYQRDTNEISALRRTLKDWWGTAGPADFINSSAHVRGREREKCCPSRPFCPPLSTMNKM